MTAERTATRFTAGSSSPLVQLKGVSVVYSSGPPWARAIANAVRSVDLEIQAGETLGLVGESGSGKTTIGRLCLGILRPTAGSVLFEGEEIDANRAKHRGHMQVVLQHPDWSLDPRLRVGTSVGEPLAIVASGDATERNRRVTEMLERVGLEARFANRYPHELSGGQRQRVAIARALITHPRFVVFDEAVSALDVSIQAQILNLIKELQQSDHFASLFISHDLAAVRYVADRIAVMYAAETVEIAPAIRFYGIPLHPYARALGVASGDSTRYRLLPTDSGPAAVGCPLNQRCPLAIERCFVEKPALRVVGDGLVACHRADEDPGVTGLPQVAVS